MHYIVGECYTFECDNEQGWAAYVYMEYGFVRVA